MRILIFGGSDMGSRLFKRFSCSTLVNMTIILLINVKNAKIVGILTYISRIND